MAKFVLNGQETEVDVAAEMPLLWVLRDVLGFTGTKYGCGIALCGACTVHIEGQATRSCMVPVSAVEGRRITTIEGMAQGEQLHPVQQAWIDEQVPQCGYCQPGMIMAVSAFLETNPTPDDEAINQTITNICRCGTYPRIRKAIYRAAELRKAAARTA